MPRPREAQRIPRAVESGWYKLFQSKSSERVACAVLLNAYGTISEINTGLRNEGHSLNAEEPIRLLGLAGVVEKRDGLHQVTPSGIDLLLDHLPYKHARISRAFIGLGLGRDEAERLLSERSASSSLYEMTTGNQEETLLGLAISAGSDGSRTAGEIAHNTGLAGPTTQSHLAKFHREGLVDATKTGVGKAHGAYSYHFNDHGKDQTIAYFLPEARVFANAIGTLLDRSA